MTLNSIRRFPTLRASMGYWEYYVTSLPLHEIASRIQPASELIDPSSNSMNEWIQRRIMPRRTSQIADYLINQEEHFFTSIVVGVYLGEPTWYEVNIDNDNPLTPFAPDHHSESRLGILELNGNEQLYAIDGQHRVAGIKEALRRLEKEGDSEAYERLANEKLSVIFVSADIEQEGHHQRVRRLFTTLNKEAKRVSLAETIALDEDDAAAIVTRWLCTKFEGLNTEQARSASTSENMTLIQLGTTNEIQPSNDFSITTIHALYRFVTNTFQTELRRMKKRYDGERPDEESLESLYERSKEIWTLMGEYDRSIGDVLGSDPGEERASMFRSDSGGHILFRPVGLQAFSGALGVLLIRRVDTERAVRSLCRVPTEISEPPWMHVLWNPNTRRMVTNNNPLAEALYLHMMGEPPRTRSYALAERYRRLYGDIKWDPFELVPSPDIAD